MNTIEYSNGTNVEFNNKIVSVKSIDEDGTQVEFKRLLTYDDLGKDTCACVKDENSVTTVIKLKEESLVALYVAIGNELKRANIVIQ
jgi:hypothetical protein